MTLEEDYAERLRVLVELDVDAFVLMLSTDIRTMYESLPEEQKHAMAMGGMHKARYEMLEIPDNLRQESRDWLEARGLKRLRNQPWPEKRTVH